MPKRPKTTTILFLALIGIGIWTTQGFAQSADPNPFFAFKKIYIAPIKDNVEGAFRPAFDQSYREVFSRNPRFEIVSKVEDSDSVLNTTINKKPAGLECILNLQVHAGKEKDENENQFASEKITLPAQSDDVEIRASAKRLLKTILKRIPFYGTISGREDASLTFDIGALSGLKKGDIVQISRVDAIRKHPLLKNILDVSMVPVGTAEVDSVETSISFGQIREEYPGEKMQRYHKITSVEARGEESNPVKIPEEGFSAERGKIEEEELARPEIGYVSVGPFLGVLSYSASQNNGAVNPSGSGLNPGIRISTEIWLTRNLFFDVDLGYSAASMSLKKGITSNVTSSFSTSTKQFAFDFGYRHYLWSNSKGPSVYGKLGYQSFTWTTPVDVDWLLGPKTFSGWRLAFGGSVPMHRSKQMGLMMNLNLGLFPSYTQSGSNLSPDSTQLPDASIVSFGLGFYNYFLNNMAFRLSFVLDVYSVEYTGGAAGYGTSNASVKQIGVLPSILFYF